MTSLTDRAAAWIDGDPDSSTRAALGDMVARGDEAGLRRCMEGVLTFGTAGIRGEVGPGPAMMNRAVVIRTTHGLAVYLGETDRPVVVGFDARPMSRIFAEDVAGVLAAAGITVVYFDEVTPTPLVAFTAKHLEAAAAVVITASHNPPADNGYKVYGADAAQIVPPMDVEIQDAIRAAPPANGIARIEAAFSGGHANVRPAPEDIVDRYWDEVAACRSRRSGSDLDVVYTPIHGVGRDVVFELMSRAGHIGLIAVAEQAEPDGTFPTVAFPNPEEPGALDLALDLARERDADLVIANDPDADRQGEGRFVFGYEEALGYTIGPTVRDKDGMSAAVIFTDLVADLADQGKTVTDELAELWRRHGLWVSAQVSISRSGQDGAREMAAAVERLAEEPPGMVGRPPRRVDGRLSGRNRDQAAVAGTPRPGRVEPRGAGSDPGATEWDRAQVEDLRGSQGDSARRTGDPTSRTG